MKNFFRIASFALALAALPVHGATVAGSLLDIFGDAADVKRVRFVPPPGGLIIGTNTVLDFPRGVEVTNGVFTVSLKGGWYDTYFSPSTQLPIRILVYPNDTNTYTFNQVNQLAMNALNNPEASITVTNSGGTNVTLSNPQIYGGVINIATNDALNVLIKSGTGVALLTWDDAAGQFILNTNYPLSGNGSALQFLEAGNIASGTVPLARLPTQQTNDLNTALVARITSATNDANTVASARTTAATNDLNTGLSAKIGNATNDLNTTIAARYLTKTNPVITGVITGGYATGTNAGTVLTNDFLYSQVVASTRKAHRLPLMTYNTWTTYGAFLTGAKATNGINYLKYTNRLSSAGFTYYCFDDGWQRQTAPFRDANGYLIVPTTNFPTGSLRPIADYAHSLGLKFGIYFGGPVGYNGWYPTQDAHFCFTNGVDYVKLDGLPSDGVSADSDIAWLAAFASEADKRYVSNSQAPLVISLHTQPTYAGYSSPRVWSMINSIFPTADGTCHTIITLAQNVGQQHEVYNQFRVVPEFGFGTRAQDYCEVAATNYLNAIKAFGGVNALLSSEYQLSTVSVSATPAEQDWQDNGATVSIVTNKDLIAINQDPGLLVGYPIATNGSAVTWLKPLGTPKGPEWALAFWNTITNVNTSSNFTFYFTNLPGAPTTMNVLDVWNHTNFVASGSISASCIEQEMKLYRLSPYVGPTTETLFSNGDYMCVSNGLVTTYLPYDVDASNYLARVSATYTPTTQEKIGIILLVNDYKANGWWTNTDIIWPFIGDSTSGVFNLKSTSFSATLTNSPTINSSGINIANSGSKAAYGPLLTGLVVGTTNNIRIFQYCGTAAPANGGFMAGTTPSGGFGGGAGFFFNGGGILFVAGNDNGSGTLEYVATTDCRGPVIVSSGGTAASVNYGAVGALVGVPSGTMTFNRLSSTVIGVGCSGKNGGLEAISTMTVSGMDVGGYLPQAQWTAFRQAWDRFEARLGRKVP